MIVVPCSKMSYLKHRREHPRIYEYPNSEISSIAAEP